ncbi:MAG TPA: hypothetical protein VEB23_07965 [Ramlibacter sp.]|nr:hypothetical protein [Ramlibacter sp.]
MNELQTPATPQDQAAKEYAAGHGGSYTVDPTTGAVTLNERTQDAVAAGNKHPGAPRNLPGPEEAPTEEAPAPSMPTPDAGAEQLEADDAFSDPA